MKSNELISYITNPTLLNKESVANLQSLVNDYPYFNYAHLLLAKALLNEEDISFQKHLKKAAIYASDREKLYELIYTQSTVETIVVEEKVIEEVKPIIEEAPVTTIIAEEKPIEPSELEKLASLLFEIKSDLAQIAQSPVSPEPLEDISNKVDVEIQAEIKEETIAISPVKENIEPNPSSFSDWLKLSKEERKISEVKPVSEPTKEPVSENTNPKKSHQNQLIDKFITDEPRIAPVRGTFYSPTHKAKLSVSEDEELVTETLAKIYELQGNLKKAIKSYETLSLKFPEKSAYFATLIEKAKEKLKHQ